MEKYKAVALSPEKVKTLNNLIVLLETYLSEDKDKSHKETFEQMIEDAREFLGMGPKYAVGYSISSKKVEYSKEDFWERFRSEVDESCQDEFDSYLDEHNESICIQGKYYDPSTVLKRVDEEDYWDEFSDFRDVKTTEFKEELFETGSVEINGYVFYFDGDEDEEE